MVGHYLLSLTPQQKDRLLTQPFEPILPHIRRIGGSRQCMVFAATGRISWSNHNSEYARNDAGYQYEYLCRRFGTVRINAAIRNRILANRACRVLHDISETASVP
jgi:hypothetical protein